jgi:hypothetical protein
MANSTLLGSSGMNSLVMTEHTHKIRVIQHINRRAANTRTKMVGVSVTKTMGVSVMNILEKLIEWGFE